MAKIVSTPLALGPEKESAKISLSELYHENTKINSATALELAPAEDYSVSDMKAMSQGLKQYKLFPKIKLPKLDELPTNEIKFDDVIASRRSIREFADAEISLEELSKILHQSYGVTGEITLVGGIKQNLRSAPSAGGLYPSEIYLAVRKVTGLEPGIYHYNVPNHELEALVMGDLTEELYEACLRQEPAREASVILLMSAVFQRTKRKYNERGYRYALLDVGHLGENIYLAATAQDLAIVTTSGFYDDAVNEILNIDGIDESTVYMAFIGKKK
ncbi:MAG: SagB/ThcOx family dehydrogenase [Nitrospinales bacterium]